MKRANIRVRRNGSSSSPHKQAPKTPPPATEPAGKENPAMVITRQEGGREWARVECRPELFALMEAAAQKCGLSPADFIMQAMEEKLARGGLLPSLPTDELHYAICQAEALNELLGQRICNPGDGGEYCDNIQVGLAELGGETFTRLRLAAEVVGAGKDGAR